MENEFITHARYMKMALQEGQKALPKCLPNPPVGCIIVREGKIIAQAYTQAPGHPHAEAAAMAQVEGSLEDCEVYVTLEPCSFQGRTPSCARTLVSRNAKKVIIAMIDPDPRNLGRGIQIMEEAGIEVILGVEQEAVSAFLSPYLNLSENHI
ncbi:MAG: bifunctional diaminohydroxyphosphoribosylaminopyrimidine deaminase/5-amino-6-(5-phosphoribosylamino)uracil reductase RibD [Bacteroidota bacterium]